MSEEKTSDNYEVGYGKPPKKTQFMKGVSGNPKGRPKKAPDFDAELIGEAMALITVNDNGKQRRITKFKGIVKQLTNKALTGNTPALQNYLKVVLPALERSALKAKDQVSESDLEMLHMLDGATEEELDEFILEGARRINEKGESARPQKRKGEKYSKPALRSSEIQAL